MKVQAVGTLLLAFFLTPTGAFFGSGELSSEEVVRTWIRSASPGFPMPDLRGPKKVRPENLGVKVGAKGAVVRDAESGVVLFSTGERETVPLASITKLLTALVLIDLPSWNPTEIVTVDRGDVREGGRWFLRFGDPVTREDMFRVMLVASGNNETMALVRHAGLTEVEFVERMNEKAKALGMTDTFVVEPIGLSPKNVSTADDLPLLLRAALDESRIVRWMAEREVVLTSEGGHAYRLPSTDELLESFLNAVPYKVEGGKTGSLETVFSLAVRVEKANHPIDIIVLGAPSSSARFADAKALAAWTFETYEWK